MPEAYLSPDFLEYAKGQQQPVPSAPGASLTGPVPRYGVSRAPEMAMGYGMMGSKASPVATGKGAQKATRQPTIEEQIKEMEAQLAAMRAGLGKPSAVQATLDKKSEPIWIPEKGS